MAGSSPSRQSVSPARRQPSPASVHRSLSERLRWAALAALLVANVLLVLYIMSSLRGGREALATGDTSRAAETAECEARLAEVTRLRAEWHAAVAAEERVGIARDAARTLDALLAVRIADQRSLVARERERVCAQVNGALALCTPDLLQ